MLIAEPDDRLLSAYAQTDATGTDNYILMQLLVVCACLAAAVLSIALLFNIIFSGETHRLFASALLGGLLLCGSLVNLYAPTPRRLALLVSVLIFQSLYMLLLFIVIFRVSEILEADDELANGSASAPELSEAATPLALSLLADWMELRGARQALASQLERGRTYMLSLCGFILFLGMVTYAFEFQKVITTQGEFYSQQSLDEMNARSSITSYFGPNRTHTGRKVLLVLLDGLRYDFVERSPDLKALLQSDRMRRDGRLYRLATQLPTMSVPNWLTSHTGAPPEMTGVLGNLLVGETAFDSIYSQAQLHNINRGLTASPWMSDIIASTLPFLTGDGTISPSVRPEVDGTPVKDSRPTADPADDLRAGVALLALNNKATPYELFLAHFSDIDMQGHSFGILPAFNPGDTYTLAVANKTRILTQLMDAIDNSTVMLVFADHGHVERGGHGGIDTALRSVPLIVYSPDSNFATSSFSAGPPFAGALENIDLAPTVAALLGLPVPRQAHGRFITDILALMATSDPDIVRTHYLDLYLQKVRLVKAFIAAASSTAKSPPGFDDVTLVEQFNQTTEWYRDAVDLIVQGLAVHRKAALRVRILRNVLVTLGLNLPLVLVMCYVVQRYSFADLGVLLCMRRYWGSADLRLNLTAFVWAGVSLVCYLLASVLLFLFLYLGYGYRISDWESTMIHTPAVVPRYYAYVLLPPAAAAYVLIRAYHVKVLRMRKFAPNASWRAKLVTCLLNVGNLFTDGRLPIAQPDFLYLVRLYQLAWVTSAMLLLFLLEASFTILIPLLFRIPFISADSWGLRFRLLTVHLMLFPLILASMAELYATVRGTHNHRSAAFDPIYLLGLRKELRRRGVSGASALVLRRHELALAPESASRFAGVHGVMDVIRLAQSLHGVSHAAALPAAPAGASSPGAHAPAPAPPATTPMPAAADATRSGKTAAVELELVKKAPASQSVSYYSSSA